MGRRAAPAWDVGAAQPRAPAGPMSQAVAVLIDGDGAIRGHGAGVQAGEQILVLFGERREG